MPLSVVLSQSVHSSGTSLGETSAPPSHTINDIHDHQEPRYWDQSGDWTDYQEQTLGTLYP